MKRKLASTLLLSPALIQLLLLLALPMAVLAQSTNGFAYITTNGTISITGYTGSLNDLTIPSTISGLPVTSIGANAFGLTFLFSVTIPNTVTNIGEAAFLGPPLLSEITVDTLNSSYSSLDGVLFDKGQSTLLQYPAGRAGIYSIPNTVTTIGDSAFDSCFSLTTITIPGSVSYVGRYAFADCGLRGVYFQGKAPRGDPKMFYDSIGVSLDATVYYIAGTTGWGSTFGGLPSVAWNPAVPYSYTATNDTITITQYIGPGGGVAIPTTITGLPVTSLGGYYTNLTDPESFVGAFQGASLTSVMIPDGVTYIGNSAFSDNTLTNVTIPNSVTNIGDWAFSGTSLTSVIIPDGVASIGNGAFDDCFGLTNVTIGNGVTSIGDQAFAGFFSLARVTIPASVTSIGDGALVRCSQDEIHGTRCASPDAIYFLGNAPATPSSAFGNAGNGIVYYLPGTAGWGTTFGGLPTALWLPQAQTADPSFGIRTNQFGFTINWASDKVVVVEATPDLAQPVWVPVSTNMLTGGASYFSDPAWTTNPSRFYRLRSP